MLHVTTCKCCDISCTNCYMQMLPKTEQHILHVFALPAQTQSQRLKESRYYSRDAATWAIYIMVNNFKTLNMNACEFDNQWPYFSHFFI